MHQGNHRDHEGAKKLFALIKDVKVAMMTTADQDGKLYSRPMWCQEADENGDLWFFTKLHSPKTAEISKDNQINLAYSDPSSQTYVSIAGKAEIVHRPGGHQRQVEREPQDLVPQRQGRIPRSPSCASTPRRASTGTARTPRCCTSTAT